mmetsp:Transcript_30064/g.100522  ORF Transcript_30064/g.100522 Transcript_30064/m.100522 type:complete len:237 (+) Transcript_30064:3-713(+)
MLHTCTCTCAPLDDFASLCAVCCWLCRRAVCAPLLDAAVRAQGTGAVPRLWSAVVLHCADQPDQLCVPHAALPRAETPVRRPAAPARLCYGQHADSLILQPRPLEPAKGGGRPEVDRQRLHQAPARQPRRARPRAATRTARRALPAARGRVRQRRALDQRRVRRGVFRGDGAAGQAAQRGVDLPRARRPREGVRAGRPLPARRCNHRDFPPARPRGLLPGRGRGVSGASSTSLSRS